MYPVLSIDHTYLAQSEDASPILVVHDDLVGCVMPWAAPCKGGFISVSARACHWMNCLRHNEVILKADREFATNDLQKTNKEERVNKLEEVMAHIKSMRKMGDKLEVE